VSTTLPQIQNNGGNKMSKSLFTFVTIIRSLLSFKIITMFKITALEAILAKNQNGAFVYIN